MFLNNTSQIKRITQLINKTNQFNSTTKRYSESEILKMMEFYQIFSFSLIDKFGDLGLISVVIVKDNNIENFLLSCRVLGRMVERKILYLLTKSNNAALTADYIKTTKNHQIESFYGQLSIEDKVDDKGLKKYYFPEKIDNVDFIKEKK